MCLSHAELKTDLPSPTLKARLSIINQIRSLLEKYLMNCMLMNRSYPTPVAANRMNLRYQVMAPWDEMAHWPPGNLGEIEVKWSRGSKQVLTLCHFWVFFKNGLVDVSMLFETQKIQGHGKYFRENGGLLATVDEKQAQTEVKSLYSAVGRLSQAQKQLQAAQQARTTLHMNWNAHLLSAVERWRAYATDFNTADSDLVQQIASAQGSLKLARSTLADQRRDGAANHDSTDAHVVSGTEEGMEETDTRAETATAITDGINTMVNSLQELQKFRSQRIWKTWRSGARLLVGKGSRPEVTCPTTLLQEPTVVKQTAK